MRGARSAGAVGALVGVIGVAVLFRGLPGQPVSATLWGSDFDPHLMVWTVEWVYHALFERLTPLDVWNANSFYPHLQTLAYADSLFSVQLFHAPLRALGVAPLPALYAALAGFCVLGAVLTDRWLHPFALSAWERALVVAAAHFALPMVSFLPSHYQLFGMQLAPPFFLALHRLLSHWRGRDLLALTAVFCLAGGFTTYFVPMTGVVSALLLAAFAARLAPLAPSLARRLGWTGPLATLALLAVFFRVQLRPYLTVFGQLAPQSMTETHAYSARPWSLVLDPSIHSFWYHPGGYDVGGWERAVFPGLALLLLAAAGAVAVLTRRPAARLEPVAATVPMPPPVPLAAYALALFAIAWVLSWGPYVDVEGHKLWLPFVVLAKLVPGVGNIRAPGRFSQFFGLPLGLLAVVALRWLALAVPARARLLAALATVAVAVESWPVTPLYPYAIAHAAFYTAARPLIGEGTPLLVLPVAGPNHLATVRRRMEQLKGSTLHWGWLVAGYGSRDTPELMELMDLDNRLTAGTAAADDLIAFARRLKITRLVLFPEGYPAGKGAALLDRLGALGARPLLATGDGVLLDLPPASP